jgi:hypothetical protein
MKKVSKKSAYMNEKMEIGKSLHTVMQSLNFLCVLAVKMHILLSQVDARRMEFSWQIQHMLTMMEHRVIGVIV